MQLEDLRFRNGGLENEWQSLPIMLPERNGWPLPCSSFEEHLRVRLRLGTWLHGSVAACFLGFLLGLCLFLEPRDRHFEKVWAAHRWS